MSSKSKILIVDDDDSIRETLTDYLEAQGFSVISAARQQRALTVATSFIPDIIILDITLSNGGGLAFFLKLRGFTEAPVIFLAKESEEVDCIISLEIGGDDFITKPCNPRELTARVKAVLRRTRHDLQTAGQPTTGSEMKFGDCVFNSETHTLTKASGKTVRLSRAERKLLMAFLTNPNRVLTRDRLLDAVQNRRKDIFDRSVDNLISRLRKKLEADPKSPRLIKTYWGGGYSLTTDVSVH